VSRNKAKAELAAHLAEDPLPLRKAKITLQAAERKAEKALKAATEARQAADDAVAAAQRKFEEAQAYLEEVKSKGGSGEGLMWWLERELTEKKKYMPTSKGGIRK
jgi:regulator of protease activity HflC (stomatin/prohibitin superfamily)